MDTLQEYFESNEFADTDTHDEILSGIRAIVRAEIINSLPDVGTFVNKKFICNKTERQQAIELYLSKANLKKL
jgi:hypothetical protein